VQAAHTPVVPALPGPARPALEPSPVPSKVFGGHEHHDCRRLLAIDDRQLLGQVLPPQLDLLVSVVEAARPAPATPWRPAQHSPAVLRRTTTPHPTAIAVEHPRPRRCLLPP
jgi:hypothetical protein